MNTALPESVNTIVEKVSNIIHYLPAVSAIALSGSYARQLDDALSDVDICVYVKDQLPSASVRENAYAKLGLNDFIYFDVDFEQLRGDGVRINGMRCDVAWFSIPKVQSILQALEHDFGCQEGLPGALSTMQTLYDPHNIISRLQNEIPSYSGARAKHRIQKAMEEAHYSVYSLGWLKKAAFRQDYFSYMKYTYELLDKLFYTWFALNRAWFSEEKRLTRQITSFHYLPKHAVQRIRSIILHQDENENLDTCLTQIKQLFQDTVGCIYQQYPDLKVPTTWA
jgi:predicted nucleotidyltransferase